jgi:hypothetical protein
VQVPRNVFRGRLRRPSPSMVVAIVALVVGISGGAYAATQINGHNIQNGSLPESKLTAPARTKLNQGTGAHWGVITRNTIGSAVADLRSGPYGSFGVTGPSSKPPFGTGSLGLQVSDNATTQSPPAEKVAFGNEVDFFGNPVSGLSKAGFRVFQTGENAAINARNMPNITLEINPHVASKTYTSMVWVPDAAPVIDQWTGYIDATTTGAWYFTNSAVATATGCDQTLTCSLAQAKAALVAQNDGSGAATIDTVAVSKGRDDEWVGAVDGLRINSTIYNFERYGVVALNRP